VGFPLKAFLSRAKKAGRSFATFHSQTVMLNYKSSSAGLIVLKYEKEFTG
jgi:hypothetical protein